MLQKWHLIEYVVLNYLSQVLFMYIFVYLEIYNCAYIIITYFVYDSYD